MLDRYSKYVNTKPKKQFLKDLKKFEAKLINLLKPGDYSHNRIYSKVTSIYNSTTGDRDYYVLVTVCLDSMIYEDELLEKMDLGCGFTMKYELDYYKDEKMFDYEWDKFDDFQWDQEKLKDFHDFVKTISNLMTKKYFKKYHNQDVEFDNDGTDTFDLVSSSDSDSENEVSGWESDE
jgi:hypothetical protein